MMSLLLAITVITSCGKDDEDGGGDDPADPSMVVANFSSQVDADNSLTYAFTNSSVVNGIDDKTFTSSWDFGGDGTSTDENPSHTFSAEGTYEVKLTVTATDGETAEASETIEVTAPKNRYAVITDTDPDDTGELRLAAPGDSIPNGQVTFRYRVAEGPVDMDIKDGFINVTGSSTSGKNSIVEVRLKDNAPHEFREGASDATIAAANFPEGVANEWVSVDVAWTSDGTNTPVYTVIINGQTVITDASSTTRDPNDADMVAEHLATVIDGARNFQWKYSDNSAVNDGVYHVDDIVIKANGEIVWEDNFQGYTKGDNLDPVDADGNPINADSPYHANTADATVGEDE